MQPFRFFLLLFALSITSIARAADPSVTAVLTESETALGHPVQLQIQITGASSPMPPSEINVEGLDVRSAGVSRQYNMNNFSVSYSFTYNYTVMPLRAGTFRIPPQIVEAGGKTLRTPELTLTVADAPRNQAQRGGPGGNNNTTNPNIDPAQIGFIEMILPKQTAYVGEMVPVQVRLGLNMRAPVESLGSGVQLAGQGFTAQKMTEPRQTVETINGRTYQVFIFKTAISPVRAGKLEVGPAEINPTVRIARGGRPQMPRGFDDPFFDQFFNDPAFAPSVPKEVPLKSNSATLEVKPLPANAPPGFNGAVGNFTLKSDANPKKAQVGDPITVTSAISGRGNFDRVTAPVLQDERGWHSYPPNEKFKQDDDVGISGAKTFELVLSPNERKPKLPSLTFAFFDPVKEAYVTLKTDEIPLQIEGNPVPTATPAVAAGPSATPPPSATPAAVPQKEQDILYQITEQPKATESFTPMYARRSFWLAQLLPLLALVGFIALRLQRARASHRDARIARLQQEAAELQRKLRHNGVSAQDYVANASRAVQLKTALARGVDPNSVDADSAATAFRLDEQSRARLERLFRESDELRYSGGQNGETLSPEKKREILELVEA
ncbi:MAG: BatD family protein, partial [Verrucomicrobiota bacterium]|nr:BatD family protein [Verrucomicrobiota bacterium]